MEPGLSSALAPELPPRDPFMEMLRPGLFAAGNPAGAAMGSGLEEGYPTGQASVLDRLGMLASYFGNALPSRGGIEFGKSPGLKALLERWVRGPLGDTVVPGDVELRPANLLRKSRIEPGGAQIPRVVDRPTRLSRYLSEAPNRQFRDLQSYRQMLEEQGFFGLPRGPQPPPYGAGIPLE